jgi:GT2 family glycosyltransferase
VVSTSRPSVRVVVLNYDGGELTLRCLASLLAHPPARATQEIVLVDNASVDGIVWQVRKQMPEVRVIESLDNLGFAGGCNLGMGDPAEVDYVALLNNDAYVEDDWISPLVEELEQHPRVGAACPKILFADRFFEIGVETAARTTSGGDPRELGLRLTAVEVDGTEIGDDLAFDERWWLREPGEADELWRRWSKGDAIFRIPADRAGRTLTVWAAALDEGTVTFVVDGRRVAAEVGPRQRRIELPFPTTVLDVVNNVGSSLFTGGYGGDRGFLESDRGQFEDDVEVFAWCGGAVLLRTAYLREIGRFDERLFLYYEDTDLSWRGRLRGWTYRYVPTSVVRHEHAATSGGEESAVFRFHVDRNRLLVLAKCGPPGLALRAHLEATADVSRQLWHHVLQPILRVRRPRVAPFRLRFRSWRSGLRLLPGMLVDRRQIRRGRAVSDRAVMAWETSK